MTLHQPLTRRVRLPFLAVLAPAALTAFLSSHGCGSEPPTETTTDGGANTRTDARTNTATDARTNPADDSGVPLSVDCSWTEAADGDFYNTPTAIPNGAKPGLILRCAHATTLAPTDVTNDGNLDTPSPYGAEIYRVIYVSHYPAPNALATTGLVIVPTEVVDGEIRAVTGPVVAFAHGTTGVADDCAPSKNEGLPSRGFIARQLAAGRVIAASDFHGLGDDSITHPYLVGVSEGAAVLDSARAAGELRDPSRNISEFTTDELITAGVSQGGHAALFAGEMAPIYAPEFDLVGVVAFAPAAELKALFSAHANKTFSPVVATTALMFHAWQQHGLLTAPADDLASIFTDEPSKFFATNIPTEAESRCAAQMGVWTGFNINNLVLPNVVQAVQDQDWDLLGNFGDRLDENTPGRAVTPAPVQLIWGDSDGWALFETSGPLRDRLCATGTQAALEVFNSGHLLIVRHGAPFADQWITDRLAGLPFLSDCP